MKKALFLFLAAILPMVASAYDAEIDGIYYDFDEEAKTAAVTSGRIMNIYSGDVSIPATVEYGGGTYSVTSIRDDSFQSCNSLTAVTIPNSVTSIGDAAFSGCSGLTSIIVESGNTMYDSRNDCNAIIETESNVLICGCKNTVIPNSVTSIGHYAFKGCSGLTAVTIGNNVTSIGWYAFSGCSGLTSITVESGNTVYDSRNDCNAIIKTGNNKLISGCKNTVIPNSVTSIGDEAFYGCSGLTSVTIPNSVTSIGAWAFFDCSGLTSVTIGNSVTSIGYQAFEGCSGLTSVTIPNSVTSIGNEAFNGCYFQYSSFINNSTITDSNNWGATLVDKETEDGLLIKDSIIIKCRSWATSVTIPNSVTSIGDEAFYGSGGLISVTIPNSVTSIGDAAFYKCSGLTSVTIGNGVTSIGEYAFYECSGLTSVTIPNSVTSIGYSAFSGCSGLTSVTIGNNVTSIGSYAFSKCSCLTSVTIPNSVTSIGWSAFSGCSGLTSVTIPNSVTSIGNSTFYGCWSLTSITIPNSVRNIGNNAFCGCSSLTSVTIPNSMTSIGGGAFFGCSGLTSVTIPNSVTSIGERAFCDCRSLTSVTIPNSVTSIEYGTFWGSGLTSVTIGNSVTNIGDYAFAVIGVLYSVKSYPETPPSLGSNAFSTFLTPLYVPFGSKTAYEAADGWKDFNEIKEFYFTGTVFKAVTQQGIEMQFRVVDDEEMTVETYAYMDGEEIVAAINPATEDDLIIPSEIDGYRVVGIGSNSFRECMGITSASLPTGITYIGEGAFRLATSLKAVTIPEGVEEIRAHSFNGCPLTTIILPSTLKRITGTYVFRNSNAKNETCSFIANMKRPSTLDENSIANMEYYDLYVPKGRKEFYLSEPQWDKFRSIREIGEVDEDVKDIVTAKSVTMKAGENATLTVSFNTEGTDYNGYQFNLYLPEGISVATDESGNFLVTEKTGRKKVALPVDDGSVLFYTTANKSHAALVSGPLMEIQLTADSALAAGKYTVRIERVVCATRDNESVGLPSSTATVTVEKVGTDTQGVITADDVEGEPASRITLPVFLNNAKDINAFYFDLTLPKGVTVATEKNGQFIASFTGDYGDTMLLSCLPWDASMGTTNNVNTWRFIATPKDNGVFRANAGRVMNVMLEVDKDMAGGVYTARMNVVKLVEANDAAGSRIFGMMHAPTSSAAWTSYSTITIKTQKQGDVNGDFAVDVADIATVISVMAGDATLGDVAHYADVNGDGAVDVADIATIIDTMAANARRMNIEE